MAKEKKETMHHQGTAVAVENELPQEEKAETRAFDVKELVKIQELKPKQKFLNLDSGAEDPLEVKSVRYELQPFDAKEAKEKKYTEVEFRDAQARYADSLVQPETERTKALVDYATRQSYQSGKEAALASGNYMQPETMSKIIDIMRNLPPFRELSASDCRTKWIKGFKDGSAAAKKILETVLAQSEFGEIDF